MKQFYMLFSLLHLFAVAGFSQSITVMQETFPNQFNTGFGVPATNNSNATFAGATGTWTGSGSSLAAIAVIPAYYSPVTNAIKIVNWNTAGLAAGYCSATSPLVNLSSYNCTPAMNFTFRLYTYACNAADINTMLQVEFSNDNGNTWSSVYSISSAGIFNNWGANNLTTITIPVTAAYRVANFRYRFSGSKPANQANNFYVFIDDPTILANPCTTNLRIGNLIWDDSRNPDGIRQGNEAGLNNVTVNIYYDANNDNIADGAAINSTVTNANGWYSFTNLAAGNYIIGANLPAGYTKGLVNAGDPDNNNDNDNNGISLSGNEVRSYAITLAAGSERDSLGNSNADYNATCDFGLVGTGSIGDFIWHDNNRNGLQDAGEAGITGQNVLLKNAAGTLTLQTTSTDANGKYRFNNLAPGTYTVKFPGINTMLPVPALVGGNMEINSKPEPATSSYVLTLAPTEINLKVDAGYKSASVLPIQFGEFSAVYTSGFAQLKWNTFSESNSSHFEIERSSDGTDFKYIGNKEAKGNSSSNTEYTFSDLLLQSGTNFYRIKMVDIDGSFSYSKIIMLNTEIKGLNLLLVYPNPFGNKVQVKIESDVKDKLLIRVFNSIGNVIRLQTENISKGINTVIVKNVAELPPGIYYLELTVGDKILKTTISKQ